MSRFHRLYEAREPDPKPVITAALDHFVASGGSAAYIVPIPNTTPPLYVACGEIDQLKALLETLTSTGVRRK